MSIAATVIGTNLVIDYGSEVAARTALDHVGLHEAAHVYVLAKRLFDRKWHQDNCPERGDFQRWYADRDRAYKALAEKFDALAAAVEPIETSIAQQHHPVRGAG